MSEAASPSATASTPDVAHRPRRRFTSLVFAGCIAICLLGLSIWSYPYYRKAKLRNRILRNDGWISYSVVPPAEWFIPVHERIGETGQRWVRELFLEDVRTVQLDREDGEIPERDLTWILNELSRCPDLQTLHLSRLQLTSSDIEALSRLSQLKALTLSGCTLAAPKWRFLSSLTGLQSLNLTNSDFATADVPNLVPLTSLRDLYLSKTQVTDDALPELKMLRSLRQLDLSESALSESASRELMREIPGLDVVDD